MEQDRLFIWWMEHKYPKFKDYMSSWTDPYSRPQESHFDMTTRIDRAISYMDGVKNTGFIKQLLIMRYGMEFIEYITERYWDEAETSQ